jgi:hypothetical protein
LQAGGHRFDPGTLHHPQGRMRSGIARLEQARAVGRTTQERVGDVVLSDVAVEVPEHHGSLPRDAVVLPKSWVATRRVSLASAHVLAAAAFPVVGREIHPGDVATGAADDHVKVSVLSEYDVGAGATVQGVHAGAAVEDVRTRPARQEIAAPLPEQRVRPQSAVQLVVTGAAAEGVAVVVAVADVGPSGPIPRHIVSGGSAGEGEDR